MAPAGDVARACVAPHHGGAPSRRYGKRTTMESREKIVLMAEVAARWPDGWDLEMGFLSMGIAGFGIVGA